MIALFWIDGAMSRDFHLANFFPLYSSFHWMDDQILIEFY